MKERYIIGAGVILGILCGSVFLFLPQVEGESSSEMEIHELFNEGQYYFNHDDSSDGVYDLEKARAYYFEVIRRDPQGHHLVWYQLGRIDFLEGRFNDAIFKFNKQKEYFGNEIAAVNYMLGLTYGYKARQSGKGADWERAEKGFKDFLTLKPESPWARTDLAWVYFSQGKYEAAEPIVERGLESDPEHPWLLNMYGLTLLNTGHREEAHQYFVRAQQTAARLTVHEWGKAYPGNDPQSWPKGLAEMRQAIDHNVRISKEPAVSEMHTF